MSRIADEIAYDEIIYEVADSILTITLNRPDRLNAFTGKMMNELLEAFDRADADDDVRAIIVTGAGRGFCAGADLASGGDTFDHRRRGAEVGISADETAADDANGRGNKDGKAAAPTPAVRDGGGRVSLRIYESLKPVIAAINGPAVGVGATMTLPMDIRLAAESARMGFVFSRRGITMEATSSWFLPRLVGISQAAEWTYSGRVFSAQEALAGRLVRSVHPDDELLDVARALASEIAQNTSAMSVALNRQMMWRMLGADHPMEAHKIDSRAITYMGASPDAREGVEAFLAKRDPEFTLRPSTDMPDFYPWWDDRPFE